MNFVSGNWAIQKKVCLLACGGKANFVMSECRIAKTKALQCRVYCWHCNAEHLPEKYLVLKICGRNITLTPRVHRGSILI